jgi:hypothetical protein
MSCEEKSNSVGKRKVDDYENLLSRALSSPRKLKPRIDEATIELPSNSDPRGDADTIKSPPNSRREKNGSQGRNPDSAFQRIVNRQLFVRNGPVGMSGRHFVEFLNQAIKTVNLCPEHIHPIVGGETVSFSKLYVLEAESERVAGKVLNLNGLFVPGGKLPLEIFRHARYNGKPEKWKTWDEVKASLAASRKPIRPHRDEDTSESPRSSRSHYRDDDTYKSSRSRVDEGNYESSRISRSHRDDDNNQSPRRSRSHYRDDDTYESSRSRVDEGNYESSRISRSHRDDDNKQSPRRSRSHYRDDDTYKSSRSRVDDGNYESSRMSRSQRDDVTERRRQQLTSSQPQKLFVGNIKPDAMKDDLLDFLGRAILQARLSIYAGSPIRHCNLIYGPNKVKQYALLEVRTEEEAQNLLHLNHIPFMGVKLIVKRRGDKSFNTFNWQALEKKLSREEGFSGSAPPASFKVAPVVREFHLLENLGGGDYEDHSGQRKPYIERGPIEIEDVVSRRTSEIRKPLVTGAPQETSRSTVSAPSYTTAEARKRLVLSAPREISGSTATATNTNDTKTTPVPGEAQEVSGSTATVGVINWESTTAEHQLGENKSDKRIPDTTKEELQRVREELDRVMQEAEVLRISQSSEIRMREEKQMVEEKQKKYEDLMIEYTYLTKDFRRVSNNLLEATDKQKELQEAMISARETREEAERVYGKEKVARERIEREMEQTLVSWKKEVVELEGKIKQRF